MKRALAILLAVGLIAGAYVLRTRVLEPGGSGPGADPGGTGAPPPGDAVVVVCATELRAACEALEAVELRVEPAGATADALVALPRGQQPTFGVWVTGASWPGLVDELRRAEGLPQLFTASEPALVARTRLALAVEEGRQGGLDAVCPDQDWECLGEAAGRPWDDLGADLPGSFELLAPDPQTTLAGLAFLGQAATGFFGTAQFGSQQFSDLRPWLGGLADGVTVAGDPVQQLIVNPAAADGAVAADADAQADVAAAIRGNRTPPVILYPGPEVVVDVVAAAVGSEGSSVEPLVQPLQTMLVDAGWVAPGAGGATPLPEGDGLPAPGVMAALRDLWEQVR